MAALAGDPSTGQVVVSFGEPVEEAFLDLRVVDADGRILSRTGARDREDPALQRLPSPLSREAPARIIWRALSQDGDIIRGEAPFSSITSNVTREAEFRPLVVLGRLLTIGAAAVLLGLALLRVWVVAAVEQGSLSYAGWRRAWWWAAASGAAGLVVTPAGHLHGLGLGLGDLGKLLGDTRWGTAWIVQALALSIAAVCAWTVRNRERPPVAAASILVAAPAMAVTATAWAGHASGGNDRAIGIGADVLHGWATGAWLGGLVGLVVLMIPALRRLPEPKRTKLGAHVVVRFSTVAVAAVAVLVVTGVYRALAELPSLDALLDAAYGRVLLVKLGIFALMLAVGGYNRFVIHPRLERAAMGLDASDRGAALALRRSVSAEVALAFSVMAAVAVLVSLPTPV